jgi:hypothetical protein
VHLPGDVAGKGEWRAMMAHELLRQAAQGAGWSKIADARDDTGRIVPLHAPAGRRPRVPHRTHLSTRPRLKCFLGIDGIRLIDAGHQSQRTHWRSIGFWCAEAVTAS